jgi:hypothetical protein
MALLHAQFLEEVAAMEKEFEFKMYSENISLYLQTFAATFSDHLRSLMLLRSGRQNARDTFLSNAVPQMLTALSTRYSAIHAYTQLQAEVNRIRHVAQFEKHNQDIQYDEADALWSLDLYKHGSSMLASAGGATIPQQKTNTTTSTIGGILAIGAGAALAVAFPGVGTAAGTALISSGAQMASGK